jgi:M6 family metalloprotease-like protein
MSSIFAEVLRFPQESGKEVELFVYGDEFYARYETKDGYTVVYDNDMGEFCYAEKVYGCLISSRIGLTKKPPSRIRRHLKEAPTIREKKFDRRFILMQPEEEPVLPFETIRTFGPNNGLLRGRQLFSGKVRGLVILVEFSDVNAGVGVKEVESMLNEEGFSGNGNYCSVRDYFLIMSGGALDYSNDVVGPIILPKHRQHYANKPFFADVLDEVVKSGIDLSRYDSRGEGIIDAVSFMYAGMTLYQGWLWPHNHILDWNSGGYKTCFYQVTSMGLDASWLSIGTFCHESGHMLCRFPDLYDYGKRDGDFEKSSGIGRYCLMSSGNHLNRGKTPAAVSAYLRDLAGWCKRIRINTPQPYEIAQGDYSNVHVFDTDNINEYFLVENRTQAGLDGHLPSSGLAVYHCDTLGSNEWQGGTYSEHYQCGLLQADGHLDLERNINNGDEGDLFSGFKGVAIGHATSPSSNLWDGSESGLTVKNISEHGEVMSIETVEK